MKQIILILFALVLISSAQVNAGLFDGEERQRRIETEQQLQQQRQSTGQWQMAAGMLGITCVVLLVVGTAIGAKARKEVGNGK